MINVRSRAGHRLSARDEPCDLLGPMQRARGLRPISWKQVPRGTEVYPMTSFSDVWWHSVFWQNDIYDSGNTESALPRRSTLSEDGLPAPPPPPAERQRKCDLPSRHLRRCVTSLPSSSRTSPISCRHCRRRRLSERCVLGQISPTPAPRFIVIHQSPGTSALICRALSLSLPRAAETQASRRPSEAALKGRQQPPTAERLSPSPRQGPVRPVCVQFC